MRLTESRLWPSPLVKSKGCLNRKKELSLSSRRSSGKQRKPKGARTSSRRTPPLNRPSGMSKVKLLRFVDLSAKVRGSGLSLGLSGPGDRRRSRRASKKQGGKYHEKSLCTHQLRQL